MFARPSSSSNFHYYDRYIINVNVAGYYLIRSTSSLDTYGYLYTNSFVSTSPLTNLFASNDDDGGNNQFKLEVFLQPNVIYILVATTYTASVTGSYSVTLSGYDLGNITKIISNTTVPTNPTSTWGK